MENHDYAEIVGKTADAPFINSLIDDYGLATNYMDSTVHPSLPNYLQMISGDTQYPGKIDVDPTTSFAGYGFPMDKENLGSQLEAAKIPWRSYQESAGAPCKLTKTTNAGGDYAPKHDPFLYFTDMQTKTPGLCAKRNVDMSEFAADLAAGTYRYMWITPNLVNDGHDPVNAAPAATLKTSDTWAKATIGTIMASAVYKANGIIFLTWDEAEGRTPGANSADLIPMIVISPNIKSKGFKSAVAYSHKSYLATVEDLLKLPRLATVKAEPTMLEFLK
jgi:phospholipase C